MAGEVLSHARVVAGHEWRPILAFHMSNLASDRCGAKGKYASSAQGQLLKFWETTTRWSRNLNVSFMWIYYLVPIIVYYPWISHIGKMAKLSTLV